MKNKLTKIKADLKEYMKAKDESKKATLRLLLSEIQNEKIKLNNGELTDEQIEAVIVREVKKVNKEIEAYKAVNQPIEHQLAEIELLKKYLPQQLSKEEIEKEVLKVISETGKNIGLAMKELSKRLKGKADMKLVSQIVKEQQ